MFSSGAANRGNNNMDLAWLPKLVLLEECRGDWSAYQEILYGFFKIDFVDSQPNWPGKRVGLKRHPMIKEKEATYWHFISEGQTEADREIDLRRCERIRWPRPTMENFSDERPTPEDRIVWWKNRRGSEERYILPLPDFSYVMIVADRGDYVLPWTHYCVQQHRRGKCEQEYRNYWDEKAKAAL